MAGLHFAEVAPRFIVERVIRCEHHHGRLLVQQGDGAVLHLGGGITCRVDVGNFLELERAFESDRETILATEEEEVVRLRITHGDLFDMGILRKDLFDLLWDGFEPRG